MNRVKDHAEGLAKTIAELDKEIAEAGAKAEKANQEVRSLFEQRDKIRSALQTLAGVSRDTDALKECAGLAQMPSRIY
jgi:flagellar hook-associated protein FlgK